MFDNPLIDMSAICITLIVIWVVAFIIVLKLKKVFHIGAKSSPPAEAMSMDDLERIHDAGMISADEFSKMRRALLGLPPKEQEISKKVPPSDDGFDIMENSDKTDNTDCTKDNDKV